MLFHTFATFPSSHGLSIGTVVPGLTCVLLFGLGLLIAALFLHNRFSIIAFLFCHDSSPFFSPLKLRGRHLMLCHKDINTILTLKACFVKGIFAFMFNLIKIGKIHNRYEAYASYLLWAAD